MSNSGSFSRQMSEKEAWKSTSKRWKKKQYSSNSSSSDQMEEGFSFSRMCGSEYECNGMNMMVKKRVMVVVDHTSQSKHAMMWALTHVANKGDLLTLLHVLPPPHTASQHQSSPSSSSSSNYLVNYLGSLCRDCKPQVEVEALVIEGPKLDTVMSQVKKLEVSVLVLGQKKPSPLLNCLCGSSSTEEFVKQCINNAECLTIGVRKRSQGTNGYLVTTRWQKNFWLLA